jgi:hypothetical protein
MNAKTALLMVASPRGFKSTSHSLGTYLLDKLQAGGFETQEIHVQASMSTPEAQAKLLMQVAQSNLLVVAFPLYVDSLPAQLIAAFEKIAQQHKTSGNQKIQRFAAIVNNGFPEASQNATAIAICKQFASEAGFEWTGSLSLGGGGAIDGAPLAQAGVVAKNARAALDIAANDLLEGKPISAQASDLMAKASIPRWLFLLVGNHRWNKQAKLCGVKDRLYDKL